MILLCPMDSGRIFLEQSMFISTEMGKVLARELAEGRVHLNKKMVPVHLPYKGLLTLDFGPNNHLRVDKDVWFSMGFPPMYQGEDLASKHLVVFPMHGLGDQMYLAVAIRALAERYPGMKVTLVKPSIASAEQWYPLIYFGSWCAVTGPVVRPDEMRTYDYYLDAEHFAHEPDYKGTYPPEFYMNRLFRHSPDLISDPVPRIAPFESIKAPNGDVISKTAVSLKQSGKPLVFVNSVSTGRVRDLPLSAVIEFLKKGGERFAFIVSSFRRPDIEDAVTALGLSDVKSTQGLIRDVGDLCHLIRNCDLVITSDSGVTHLAEALSVPCGSVFNVVTPEERIKYYRFSESLKIDFSLNGICSTPCYVHALEEGDLCPGMAHINQRENARLFYDYPPCAANLTGEHLLMLLDELFGRFGTIDKGRS